MKPPAKNSKNQFLSRTEALQWYDHCKAVNFHRLTPENQKIALAREQPFRDMEIGTEEARRKAAPLRAAVTGPAVLVAIKEYQRRNPGSSVLRAANAVMFPPLEKHRGGVASSPSQPQHQSRLGLSHPPLPILTRR